MDYDFSGLNDTQQAVLTFQGWHVGFPTHIQTQPPRKHMKLLVERGLVIERKRMDGWMEVWEYEVTIPVHFAWCSYCAENE